MHSHICHVITNLGAGGAEQYVIQQSNFLAANGVRVSIIADEPHILRNRLDRRGHIENLQLGLANARSLLSYVFVLFRAIKRFITFFKNERVTVVHTHLVASALPAWIAAKLCGIPVVHSKMHAETHGSKFSRILFASRLPLLLVDRFLVFTKYAETEAAETWRVPRSRIITSSIGVDLSHYRHDVGLIASSRNEFGLTQADRVMLVVARLHPEKDVELAIRSACALDIENGVLLIVGDGQERERLEKLAQSLPSQTKIKFLGLLKDPRPAYAAADILLQTTRGPDLGVVVLEAMASGLPVVIAFRDEMERKMANCTLEEQEVGCVTKAQPTAMADAITQLFSDPVRLRNMRDDVRAFAKTRHSTDLVYPALARCYADIESGKN